MPDLYRMMDGESAHPLSDRWRYYCLLFFVMSMLFACTPFKPVVMPDAAGDVPATYALYGPEPDVASPWWESVASPELSRLIDDALSGSFALKEAWARLRQVNALAVQVGADLYPELAATGSAEYTRRRSELSAGSSEGDENYAIGLVSSYEIDLWGRVRSQQASARLDVDASRSDMHTAMVTIAGEVADRWVRIISLRLQKQLLQKQLDNNLTILELIELRFRKAMVSALDVYQQTQAVERVRSQIPLVEAQTQLLLHELAVLLGRPPRADLDLMQRQLPVISRLPAVGLPVDLLANRPDVRAAGMRLKSAQWQVSAARANRLPALRLSADAGYGRSDLDLLFNTWLLSLAGNLTAPIFDGGRRAAEVDRTRAQVDENLWAYRRTVLTAVKEVEDALVSEVRQREHIEGLRSLNAAAQKGLEEAIDRYRNGLSDYLPVITQLLSVQDLERNLISQQEQLVLYRVGLHRALGGGWPAEVGYLDGAVGARYHE